MDLYDPDRAQGITRLGVPATWDAFLIALEEAASCPREKRQRFSPADPNRCFARGGPLRLQAVLKSVPNSQWHQFEPAGAHSARAATEGSVWETCRRGVSSSRPPMS